MRLWRSLKESGCGVLRDGVYVLPSGDGAALAWLESQIRAAGGFAMTLEVKPGTESHEGEIRRLFDRSRDYGALVKSIAEAKASLPRIGPRRAQTAIRRLERSRAHTRARARSA
jgi:hypothetical protein